MRSLMLCLVVLPFVISCGGSSETNKAGIPSESQSTSQDISPDNGMETITNSIGMRLVLIPKGTFQMGSPIEEAGSEYDETQHQVTISKDYYLGVTEVTQGQYEKVMGTNPSYFQGVSVQRSIRFLGAVGLANWAKKGHPLWPSGAPDPGGIEAISRW